MFVEIASPESERKFRKFTDFLQARSVFLVRDDVFHFQDYRGSIGSSILKMVGDELHLLDVYVLPQRRSIGLSKTILRDITDGCDNADLVLVTLVREPNNDNLSTEGIVRLLARAGFEPMVHSDRALRRVPLPRKRIVRSAEVFSSSRGFS